MFSVDGSFRGSRGACFAQMLMKNLPVTSDATEPCKPPPVQSTVNYSSEDVFTQQERSTVKTGEFTAVNSLIICPLHSPALKAVQKLQFYHDNMNLSVWVKKKIMSCFFLFSPSKQPITSQKCPPKHWLTNTCGVRRTL